MSFRILGLDPAPFRHLYDLTDAELAAQGAKRYAIFVREGADRAYDGVDVIPDPLRARLISLRAFDGDHDMVDADVVDGPLQVGAIERFFTNPAVHYLQARYAKRGCYAARVERA